MRTVDLLRRVRDGESCPADALKSFIDGITRGDVPKYQAAAFLMAVYLKGLDRDATVALTEAMRDSGRVVKHPRVSAPKIDKHSTGGVGDKISICLAPLVGALGVAVPMISGRGLGHTGGTLDKLEAIDGFQVQLPIERFVELVETVGVGLIGQTDDLAPADRILYALRDVTATVESIPLITASILSKKLAEGIDGLVLDVKVGRGAFMKDEASARALAQSLVSVGRGAGLETVAVLTRMEQPLGTTIGNALETREAIEILKGEGPDDTTELTMVLATEMLRLGKVEEDEHKARAALQRAIEDGSAADKLREIIAAQGGDTKVVDDPQRLPRTDTTVMVESPVDGVVREIDSYALGLSAMKLGAGRATADDTIDPAVGIELLAKVGTTVAKGEPLARLHVRNDPGEVVQEVIRAYALGPSDQPVDPGPLVIDYLR